MNIPPKEILLKVGEKFSFILDANPTTGYDWFCRPEKTDFLAINKDFIVGNHTVEGRSSHYLFSIYGLKRGSTVLDFKYQRPWEEILLPIENFTIKVTVI